MSQFDSRERKHSPASEENRRDESSAPREAGDSGEVFEAKALPIVPESSTDLDAEVRGWGERLEKIIASNASEEFRSTFQLTPSALRERITFYVLESYNLPRAPECIVANLDLVPELDRELLAQRLFDRGPHGAKAVATYLSSFKDVDGGILVRGLLKPSSEVPLSYWIKDSTFLPTNVRDSLFMFLIARGGIEEVLNCIQSIPVESQPRVATRIVDSLLRMPAMSHKPVAVIARRFVERIDQFHGVAVEDIFKKLVCIDGVVALRIAGRLADFPDIDNKRIAASFLAHVRKLEQPPAYATPLHDLLDNFKEFSTKDIAAKISAIAWRVSKAVYRRDVEYSRDSLAEVSRAESSKVREYQDEMPAQFSESASHVERCLRLGREYGRPFDFDGYAEKNWQRFPQEIGDLASGPPVAAYEWGWIASALRTSDWHSRDLAATSVKDAVANLLVSGRFSVARMFLQALDLKEADIRPNLSAILEHDFKNWSVKDCLLIAPDVCFGLGAWCLYEPDTLHGIASENVRELLTEAQSIFGNPTPRLLDHYRRNRTIEIFLEKGVPLLKSCRMIRDDTLPILAKFVPTLLSEAGTIAAWEAHGINLVAGEEGVHEARWMSPADIEFELGTMLEFYRRFHGAGAPLLYEEFRSRLSADRVVADMFAEGGSQHYAGGLAPMLEWQRDLEGGLLHPDLRTLIIWDDKRIEYLDAWTRAKGRVQERKLWVKMAADIPAWRFEASAVAVIGPEELGPAAERLRRSFEHMPPRCVSVALDTEKGGIETQFSSQVRTGYGKWRQLIIELQEQPLESFLRQEAAVIGSVLTERRATMERWLGTAEASRVPEWVSKKNRDELNRLTQVIEEIEKEKSCKGLIDQLLQVNHKSTHQSLVRLLVADGLWRHPDSSELRHVLQEELSTRSLTALGEFVKNQLLDESLRALDLSGARRKAVVNALPSCDFEAALRERFKEVRPLASDPPLREQREIMVYPTRGILAELAGFFSDACWTDKIDLMKDHPNATALVFVSPEKHEFPGAAGSSAKTIVTNNLVGACYLLEAKDTAGNEVVVIRGINPRERPFEKLSMQSFIEGLIDEVVVPYAREVGVKKVVIPFDELGHAQTNRLRVGAYLEEQYGQMPIVPLDPKGPNTNFNDRRIFDKCRLVREL